MTATALAPEAAVRPRVVANICTHCGLPAACGDRFCCAGCATAFEVIGQLGFGRYYLDRLLDPARRAPRPDDQPRTDLVRHVIADGKGRWELTVAVDGLQCGACVWLIESVLAREPHLLIGRINMTSRRLRLVWQGAASDALMFSGRVEQLGYRLVPFEMGALAAARETTSRNLLRALAVSGFAAGNVMFLALGTWMGARQGMGPATVTLLHFLSALIALPAIAYSGRVFFSSAFSALRRGRTNMDVPVSIGVILVAGLSLWQTVIGGDQTYFESATMLLFFLLAGRVMDHRARGQARAAAEDLLSLRGADVGVLSDDGSIRPRPQHEVISGDLIVAGMGERIGADGVVISGESMLDASLVTGESLPRRATPGTHVFAGTLNLGSALTLRVTEAGAGTLLAECVRMIEAAEARRGRFVVLADRIARAYAPVVHLCALATFLFWYFAAHASFATSLLSATAVLIITCPCALALAVPAVQLIATGRLFGAGVLLKSATALERVAEVTLVCFDKTGTLTEPELRLDAINDPEALDIAAGMAAVSRHPLARALCAAAGPVGVSPGVIEHPGEGLSCGSTRLGSARFCGLPSSDGAGAEMWLTRPGRPPVQFSFTEHVRADARDTIDRLRRMGLEIRLLSGDRAHAVSRIATTLGIETFEAECLPARKVARIAEWTAGGAHVFMVGDGLNDGPALGAASVSASPSSAADVSKNVADMIYQGRNLAPVAQVIATARRARGVMRENIALALCYNALFVPAAIAGFVTPWLAAAAMSGSSLLVVANSARLGRKIAL